MTKNRSDIGKSSRAKGKRGELEVSKLFQEAGWKNARRAQQYNGVAAGNADVIGIPGLHVEVKRVERLNLSTAYEQSARDAETAGQGEIPIVVHRKSREPWMVSMSLNDFLTVWNRSQR